MINQTLTGCLWSAKMCSWVRMPGQRFPSRSLHHNDTIACYLLHLYSLYLPVLMLWLIDVKLNRANEVLRECNARMCSF